MTEPKRYEIWRVEYKNDAYKDQTGMAQYGYVVHRQIIVTQTGSFPLYEAYSKRTYAEGGIIAQTKAGEIFNGRRNLVDYWGGIDWASTAPGDGPGRWQSAPSKALGYVYPDGSGPVKHLLVRSGAKAE